MTIEQFAEFARLVGKSGITYDELIERWNIDVPESGRETSPWQPIETAPKASTYVLLYYRDEVRADLRNRIWVGMVGQDIKHKLASHWQPLPEPPE